MKLNKGDIAELDRTSARLRRLAAIFVLEGDGMRYSLRLPLLRLEGKTKLNGNQLLNLVVNR